MSTNTTTQAVKEMPKFLADLRRSMLILKHDEGSTIKTLQAFHDKYLKMEKALEEIQKNKEDFDDGMDVITSLVICKEALDYDPLSQ